MSIDQHLGLYIIPLPLMGVCGVEDLQGVEEHRNSHTLAGWDELENLSAQLDGKGPILVHARP